MGGSFPGRRVAMRRWWTSRVHLPAGSHRPPRPPHDQPGHPDRDRHDPVERRADSRCAEQRPEDAGRRIHHAPDAGRIRRLVRDRGPEEGDRPGPARRAPAAHRAAPHFGHRRPRRLQQPDGGSHDRDADPDRRRPGGAPPRNPAAVQVRRRLDQADDDRRGHVGGRRPERQHLHRGGSPGRGRGSAPPQEEDHGPRPRRGRDQHRAPRGRGLGRARDARGRRGSGSSRSGASRWCPPSTS